MIIDHRRACVMGTRESINILIHNTLFFSSMEKLEKYFLSTYYNNL